MTKITLTDLVNLQNETTAVNAINANNATLETAIDNTLSRDGTAPNTMGAAIDMNSNQIYNLPAPSTVNSPARLIDVTSNPTIVVPGTGTSGHTVPFLDGNNTWSGTNTFTTQAARDNSTKVATTAYVDTAYRERLSAARTYYVRTNGSDSNTGLVDTAGGAFLTIQRAVNIVMGLDLNSQNITIQIADGTYTEAVNLGAYIGRTTQGHTAPSIVVIQGNTATPGNVILNGSFTATETGSFEWIIRKMRINGVAANSVYSDVGSWVVIDGVEFGTTTSNHIVSSGGFVEIVGNYTILGNAFSHMFCVNGGKIEYQSSYTVTLTGTPAFTYFAYSETQGLFLFPSGLTYSGAATGGRFYLTQASCVSTTGGGILTVANLNTLLPGNANGTVSTQFYGTQTNDAASAGNIGELVSSTVALASAVALTTATPANVTSISLTPGDWDVSTNLYFNLAATTTVTVLVASISQTSASLDTTTMGAMTQVRCGSFTPASDMNVLVGPLRITLAATTTVYLVAQSSFGTSTNKGYGIIRARRVR